MDMELQKYLSLMERNESFRPVSDPSADMDSDEKSRFIQYLFERIRSLESELAESRRLCEKLVTEIGSLRKTHEDSMQKLTAKLGEVQDQLRDALRSQRKTSRQLESYREKYEKLIKEKFGSKKDRPSAKSRKERENPDDNQASGDMAAEDDNRTKAQEDYDGTPESAGQVPGPVEEKATEATQAKPRRDSSNHPQTHNWMKFNGTPVTHPNDDSKVPGKIVDRKNITVFSLYMGIRAENFEKVKYAISCTDPNTGRKKKTHRWEYFACEGHPQEIPMFDGAHATPEFMQALAYEVFMKNTSIGTVKRQLGDLGLQMSDNALNNWLRKGKKYLDRMIAQLKEIALEKDSIVNCDESWCRVKKYDKYRRGYVWVIVNKEKKIVILFYDNGSRGNQVLRDFVGDHELRAIMTDGYVGYNFIDGQLEKWENTTHLVDWVHINRYFTDAVEAAPSEKDIWQMREQIGLLFSYEREYARQGLSPGEIKKRRNDEKTKSTVARLKALLLARLQTLDECTSDAIIKAIRYLDNHWDNAMRYREDGRYPMDNNAAERAFRPWAMKRKTTLQFGSDEGAEMAAAYHSIVETVKMCGRSVWHFFGDFFKKVIDKNTDIGQCLPQNLGLSLAGN